MTAEIFGPYWPTQTGPIADAFNGVPKYIASRGDPDLSWRGSEQVTDVASEVPELRRRHRLIHTWGSTDLLQTLFREGLVGQVNLWTFPIVLGSGRRFLPEGSPGIRFELAEPVVAFPDDVVLARYRVRH